MDGMYLRSLNDSEEILTLDVCFCNFRIFFKGIFMEDDNVLV
jgi:hypothetical protein